MQLDFVIYLHSTSAAPVESLEELQEMFTVINIKVILSCSIYDTMMSGMQ